MAEQILSLYNTTDDNSPIFPLPKRDTLWYCIHEIGIVAGVKENLSYHASRHSFGTLTLSAGVPIESISKMMGHTNIRTTQGYARVTDDKIGRYGQADGTKKENIDWRKEETVNIRHKIKELWIEK